MPADDSDRIRSDDPQRVGAVPYLEQWKADARRRLRGFQPGQSRAFAEARHKLQLTPEEQYLYRHHLFNLARGGFTHGPPGTPNPGDWPPRDLDSQGSISTLYQTSVPVGGRYYNLPTVWDNQIVTEDQALQRAQQAGLARFPSYDSEEEAEQRYAAMHHYLEQDMRDWFQPR